MNKIIFAALLAVALSAQAKTWTLPNQAGGKIVLTDRECTGEPALRSMFSYASEGSVRTGCWKYIDSMVRVIWSDGSQSAFDAANFRADQPSKNTPTY